MKRRIGFLASLVCLACGCASPSHPAPMAVVGLPAAELATPALAPPPAPSTKSKLAFRGSPASTDASSAWVLLKNKGYDIGYSELHKDPVWAAYTLKRDTTQFDSKRPSTKFANDPRVSSGVTDHDYVRSGYDRGHMAPSDAIGRWFGPDAQNGTFIVTNICPQKHNNNAGDWAGLEAAVTDLYADDFEQVWVICGPIFSDHPKKMNGIDIPASFYKIIVEDDDEGDPQVLAVIMDQGIKGMHDVSTYVTTVRTIEGLTHLNFFPELPKEVQDRIETAKADDDIWKTDTLLNGQQLRNR